MTNTNKCKGGHTFFEQIGEFGNRRICYICGLKQIKRWLDDTSEEM